MFVTIIKTFLLLSIFTNSKMDKSAQLKIYHNKLVDFYKAPCVRHAYQVVSVFSHYRLLILTPSIRP